MTTETKPNQPTHLAYYVKGKADGEMQDWIKVGAAWEHGDKDGMNLSLRILGQDVAVTIRRKKPKAD